MQSTTILLLAVEGVLPLPDVAIFADTGWEPAEVYQQVDRLEKVATDAGVKFHRVSNGDLRNDAISPEHRYASIPYFVRNPDGSDGMGRRQCTSEYKLVPINRKVRELLGAPGPDFRRVKSGQVCEQWIGFSTDEIGRVSDKQQLRYITKRYPLLELGMSRDNCQGWLEERGWGHTVKSACIGCPFHGNRQWRELRDTCVCGHHRSDHWRGFPGSSQRCAHLFNPGAGDDVAAVLCQCKEFQTPEWDDAVAFDESIRKGGARGLPLNGEAFLHRSRVPLSIAPIDRVMPKELQDAQLELQLEFGDPDGCSPYGCRSGVKVP